MNSAWQVRAGQHGERDQEALREGLVILGWERVPNLDDYGSRAELGLDLRYRYAEMSHSTVANWTGQLWRFSREIVVGDLVVMPIKTLGGLYAIGDITGNYGYRTEAAPGFRHVRAVRWSRTDVHREEIGPDLLSSLSAQLTVCRLARHRALDRLRALSRGQPVTYTKPTFE
ncbi:restriction endonuclease [Amycolatopsis sp. NPDC059657]|uniref:restriction endonuclease n=1 Tax=Amycolatopsis sp. NPDC059657 TaxID=3346899 RepID=UPI00366DEFD4